VIPNACNFWSGSKERAAETIEQIELDIGYNILSKPFILNVLSGYRQANFDLETNNNGTVIEPKYKMIGPFRGLNAKC